jgi:hypothetical protein
MLKRLLIEEENGFGAREELLEMVERKIADAQLLSPNRSDW